MESGLSMLKDLLDLRDRAKLTLPGAVCAAFLVMIFWPPKPIDVFPVVQSSSLMILPPDPPFKGFVQHMLIPKTLDPVCAVDEYYLAPLGGITEVLFKTYRGNAQRRQYVLEEQNENLERCLAAEKRLVGAEQVANANLQRDLAVLEAAHAKQIDLMADYEKSDSPLITSARRHWEDLERIISAKRLEIARKEQAIRDREWKIAELTRWKGIVSDHLAEPGRLRPEVGFDDYLAALSKHVLAFIVLAAMVGMVIEGISTPGVLESLESILFGS
jgi:hypothetical protein